MDFLKMERSETSDKKLLENSYQEILNLKIQNKKYFHLRSVGNFIYHIDSFTDLVERKRKYEQLAEYLALITNILQEDKVTTITAFESRDLFDEYLYPIAKSYESSVGFFPYAKLHVIAVWFAVLSLTFFMLNIQSTIYSILIPLFIIYYLFIQHKRIKNRVYGCFY